MENDGFVMYEKCLLGSFLLFLRTRDFSIYLYDMNKTEEE